MPKKETYECACCKDKTTKEELETYGGLCDFCYPGLPADWEAKNLEVNGCDCCQAGRQY